MNVVRVWWPPVVVGLVIAMLGIGTVEVAGLTPTTQVAEHPVVQPSSAAPADIERLDGRRRARPSASTPTPSPTPARPARVSSHPVSRGQHATATPAPKPTPRPSRHRPKKTTRPAPHPGRTTPPVRPQPIASAPVTSAPVTSAPAPKPVVPTPEPTPVPTPVPTVAPTPTTPPRVRITRPTKRLDLRRWKLTLPVGPPEHPLEVTQPRLSRYVGRPYFRPVRNGMAFRAPVGGVTTGHSSYPRSELREMTADGTFPAHWTNARGRHAMTVTEAITATPRAKPHVVAAQIHDDEDDVVMIRLEGHRLFVESGGEDVGLLDAHYRLGRTFRVSIVASPSGITVTYDGRRIVRVRRYGNGWYFKAGCYPQSNPDRGDRPTSYGEVVIYALKVRHES